MSTALTGPRRVLLVCFSQSGQLRRCADAFVEPMRRAGAEVDVVTPRPLSPFPWPWGFGKFLEVFPECVESRPPPMEEPSLAAPHSRYDLVVVAYQVWYLAPALPVVGWLQSPAASVLKDTPVIALCACRNMWQRAFVKVKELVTQQGGQLIDHVVREDSGPAWATFWTTPRWVISGDKTGSTGFFPPAGVSDEDIASLGSPGSRVATALVAGTLSGSVLKGEEAPLNPLFVIPELIARFFFGWWAKAIGSSSGWTRFILARVFFVCLCSSVPLILPMAVVALFIRLFAKGWFQGKVNEITA